MRELGQLGTEYAHRRETGHQQAHASAWRVYCAARNITADVELIRPDEINRAWDRVVNKDVRYRFVIDVASSKKLSPLDVRNK